MTALGLLESGSGTSWTPTSAPEPGGGSGTFSGVVSSACASATACLSWGGVEPAGAGVQSSVAETFSGAGWSASSPPAATPPVSTATSVVVSPTSVTQGTAVTYTATVASAVSGVTVTFYIGSGVMCTH